VGGTDLAQRYEVSIGGDTIGFSTFFKSGSADLSTLFQNYNYAPIIQYLLSVYSGSGGGMKNSGTYAPITASAAPTHYSFDQWLGDTVVSPTSAQTTILMSAAKTVSASYAVNQWTLTVTNGTGDGTFGYFDNMPITASSAPSYQIFNNWSNPVGDLSFVNSALSQTIANFTADGDATAEAVYNWILYNVQANNGSGGDSTVLDGDGDGGVLQLSNNDNQQYTLLANPSAGYYFVNWLGDTGGIGNVNASSSYIIVTGDAYVTSSFAPYQAATGITWSEANPSNIAASQVINIGVTPSGGTSPFVYDWWINVDGAGWTGPTRDGSSHNFGTIVSTTTVEVAVEVRCQGYEAAVYDSDTEGNNWIGNVV
jgi:hypothetical protein